MPEQESKIITLNAGDSSAQIYNGQVVSYICNGIEYFHGGGKPVELKKGSDCFGWQNSGIEMFPIIGSTNDNKVQIGSKFYPQDKHGVSRSLGHFVERGSVRDSLFLVQKHDGITHIKNVKYKPGSNSPEFLEWPFAFKLEKKIYLTEEDLTIGYSLTNLSEEEMPFMFGSHPALKNQGFYKKGIFMIGKHSIEQRTLEQVIEESTKGSGSLIIKGADKITYFNEESGRGFKFSSANFPYTAFWSPGEDAGMFCIEPLTNEPVKPKENRRYFTNPTQHMVLAPDQTKSYMFYISPIDKS